MNTPREFTPAGPDLRPKGYGGIYPSGGWVDPFWDFDMPNRIISLANDLLEHPGTRSHLERYGLAYRSHPRGVLLGCTKCEVSPCSCGDLHDRSCEYMVAIFRDPDLRPLFEARQLSVRGG